MESLKVLIPTDFSVQAEYAYLMVKKLKEKTPTEIHFIHVLDLPYTVAMDGNGKIQTCGEIDVNYVISQKEIADRKLNNLKTIYGQDIQTHLVLGKVTETILSYSTSNQFDLIVMGTKGAWGLKEILSGSETQIIARKSETPLLSLMCDRSDLIIKNILLVHDYRNPTHENLTLLKKLIKAFDAKVHQLQIVSKQTDEEKANLLCLMDQYASDNTIVNYENHLINDIDVENGVIYFNQMHNIDVICIGTHGKGSLFHASATEKLINHLFKPIISYHIKN